MRRRSALTVALLAVLAWASSSFRAQPLNILVITLDTTRADRLAPYGLMDVPMPHLSRLADESVVFDQAITPSPLTLPAHISLFTGLLPPRHGVRDNADRPLADAHTTLAEALRSKGFRTAAFVGSAVLDAPRGLGQGFDVYRGVPASDAPGRPTLQRRGDDVTGEASAWLKGVGEAKFFLWAHLYDPHRPYDPPDPYGAASVDPYVGELAFVDSQVGRLLTTLEERGLLERTIVVIAGDHGESLGEHGETDHGVFLYDSVVRVPLLIRAPRVAPRRVPELVRLTDVMPTVLDLLDVAPPKSDGVSLAGVMRGQRHGLELEAYSESLYPQRFGWSPLYALRDGRFKFIEAPTPELYDMARDPFEERNIARERPAVVAAMQTRLRSLSTRGSVPAEGGGSPAPKEVQERLAALGYVGSGPLPVVASTDRLPDPKDCMAMFKGTPSKGLCTSRQAR